MDPSELASVMQSFAAMRTFADWVSAGATPPIPTAVDIVFPQADARLDGWPDWAPWVPTAHHALHRHPRDTVIFAKKQGSLLEELRALLPTVGLKAVPLPFPAAMLPMDMLVASPSGERSSTGRLVTIAHVRDAHGTSVAAGALVRP
jgi:hypothetical protein